MGKALPRPRLAWLHFHLVMGEPRRAQPEAALRPATAASAIDETVCGIYDVFLVR